MVQITPGLLYTKYKLLWDCLSQLLSVKIAPFTDHIENSVVLYFVNSGHDMRSIKGENVVIFKDQLDSIDPVLVRNLFNNNGYLFEIIKEIKKAMVMEKEKSVACITIDDPALFSNSYGFIKYHKLVESCKKYNTHCCIAIVPVDTWYHNKDVVRLFHANSKYVSLCIHGVLHLKDDLDRMWGIDKCISYLNYGLKLIKRFEQNTGLRVSRFIVPPHERLSKSMLEAIAQTEIKGIITAGKVYGYTNDVNNNDYLAGMFSEYCVLGKIPVLLRDSLAGCANHNQILQERMKNRVVLNQPVLFVGHHYDFVHTDNVIKDISCFVDKLDISWSPITDIEDRMFGNRSLAKCKNKIINGSKISRHLLTAAYLRRLVCVIRDSIKIRQLFL